MDTTNSVMIGSSSRRPQLNGRKRGIRCVRATDGGPLFKWSEKKMGGPRERGREGARGEERGRGREGECILSL